MKMEIEMVLNELSLRHPAPDTYTARQWMSDLIGTINAIAKYSSESVSLRTQYDFHSTQLAPNYPLFRWLNDQEVDQMKRDIILTLATNSPFSHAIDNPDIQDIENNQANSEYRYEGERAIGLGVAHLLETIAISFPSADCWDYSYISVDIIKCEDNDEDNKVEIRHASHKDHVEEHADWIKSCTQVKVRDGVDLWQCKEDLFPHLHFCNAVEKQLKTLLANAPMLQSVQRRLFELENSSNQWTSGAFDWNTLPTKATPESDSRLKQFEQALTIECPDGESRLFSLHVRMTPGAWRLYFSTDLGPGQIIIGYIGPKL
ncbi:hypothetical protein [Oscillatoria acuminata]|uniref:Uncharacterized protein n=1 Tax=Oscillatoria acuminata PCC 6304 TaxID=56110 RepID=K9TJD0_9CYAN|nr:hypothetical protein [Oscillatoria acuminata]AFY82503.1 hypothetical protein Oscil6304_2902 [Oscillatoria acuminata PCC 6304]